MADRVGLAGVKIGVQWPSLLVLVVVLLVEGGCREVEGDGDG